MAFDTMLGGQSPKTGNAEPTILYAADGVTPLSTEQWGGNRDLAVVIDNVSGSTVDGVDVATSYTMPGPFGNGIRGWLGSLYKAQLPVIPVSQEVLHAANSIVLPAAGANTRNVFMYLGALIRGTGTAPTQASPVTITVLDGGTIVYKWSISAFTNNPLSPLDKGFIGSVNTSMTFTITDPGLNNTTNLNIGYTTLYIP